MKQGQAKGGQETPPLVPPVVQGLPGMTAKALPVGPFSFQASAKASLPLPFFLTLPWLFPLASDQEHLTRGIVWSSVKNL